MESDFLHTVVELNEFSSRPHVDWIPFTFLKPYIEKNEAILDPTETDRLFDRPGRLSLFFSIYRGGWKAGAVCKDTIFAVADGVLADCLLLSTTAAAAINKQAHWLKDLYVEQNPHRIDDDLLDRISTIILLERWLALANGKAKTFNKADYNSTLTLTFTITFNNDYLSGHFVDYASEYLLKRSVSANERSLALEQRVSELRDEVRDTKSNIFNKTLELSALVIAVFSIIGVNVFTDRSLSAEDILLTNLSMVVSLSVIFFFVSLILQKERKVVTCIGIISIVLAALLAFVVCML